MDLNILKFGAILEDFRGRKLQNPEISGARKLARISGYKIKKKLSWSFNIKGGGTVEAFFKIWW